MRGSWRIGTLASIGIYMHWTFLLLVAWVMLSYLLNGASLALAFGGVALILALFGCVVLHELGHALMARRFGVATQDITLLPIGGVARLARMPEEPKQELLIALAGPAVNVVIAAVLGAVLWVVGGLPWDGPLTMVGQSFLANLLVVNLILVVFNLLPAFPMDGGRVLRALLAMRRPYGEATQIAAKIGQIMAILFGIVGVLNSHWMLLLIAFFIFAGGQAEAAQAELKDAVRGLPVREAMTSRFTTLHPQDPITDAGRLLMEGYRGDFAVAVEDEFIGILRHRDVTKAILGAETEQTVADLMQTECPTVAENEPLSKALERMTGEGCDTVAVLRHGAIVGMLSLARLGEWVSLHTALEKPRRGQSRSVHIAEQVEARNKPLGRVPAKVSPWGG